MNIEHANMVLSFALKTILKCYDAMI